LKATTLNIPQGTKQLVRPNFVYMPCTSEPLFPRFWRVVRLEFSITCVFSIDVNSSTPLPRLHYFNSFKSFRLKMRGPSVTRISREFLLNYPNVRFELFLSLVLHRDRRGAMSQQGSHAFDRDARHQEPLREAVTEAVGACVRDSSELEKPRQGALPISDS